LCNKISVAQYISYSTTNQCVGTAYLLKAIVYPYGYQVYATSDWVVTANTASYTLSPFNPGDGGYYDYAYFTLNSPGYVTIKVHCWNVDLQGYQFTSPVTFNSIALTLSGPSDVCINGSYTYTTSINGASPTSYSWTYPSGFNPNGSTTSSSINFTIGSSAVSGNVCVTANGTGCSTIPSPCEAVTVHTAVPGTPTNNITAHRIGSYSCYYSVSVPSVSGATTYEWADNSSFSNSVITTTNSTKDAGEGDMIEGTAENIYVRTHNGCGYCTGHGYKYVTFPALQNCTLIKSSRLAEQENNSDMPQLETISFYTDNASGNPGINFPVADLQAAIQVYSIEGKLIKNEVIDQQNYLLDISNLPQGIYILRASQGNIIINHKFAVVK
jgi:hypothetical protein